MKHKKQEKKQEAKKKKKEERGVKNAEKWRFLKQSGALR